MIKPILAAVVAVAFATSASAASLLTSAGGYTGPKLNLGGFNAYYTFTAGPVSLPGGITYTSTDGSSVIGKGGYGLNDNGFSSNALIVGTNSPDATVTFTFASPVAAFGGGLNYALINGSPVGNNPTIAAYDASNVLIGSYDLFTLAPISTPGGSDAFVFRGIDGEGTLIASFTLSGAYLIIQGTAVPEPASWALMIGGFGLVGAAARRRRTAFTA